MSDNSMDNAMLGEPPYEAENLLTNHGKGRRGGVRQILRVATPLILASSSHAIRLFCDRLMLARFASGDFSASLSAGVTWFTLCCFFMGIVGYASTFVAQYVGANRPDRVGKVIWQGVFLAIIGALVLGSGAVWAPWLFDAMGHDVEIRDEQVGYFRILCLGTIFPLMLSALSAFWNGRGKTWTIAGIELVGVVVNVFANWVLIFGHLGLPAMGVKGAGLATVASSACSMAVACLLLTRRTNLKRFNIWPDKKFEAPLFGRIIKFGLPNGVSFFLDVAAFNVFVVLVGRFGEVERLASTIAFSMNAIAFIPMIGLGMTTSILVGQAIGGQDIPFARRAVRSARVLILSYMGAMMLLFLGFPQVLEPLFPLEGAEPEQVNRALEMSTHFLRYIAAYLLFDGVFILYVNAIRGAGDTRFSMWVTVVLSWCVFAIPCIVANYYGCSVWVLWRFMVSWVVIAAIVFYIRYRMGAWQTMSVIEQASGRES